MKGWFESLSISYQTENKLGKKNKKKKRKRRTKAAWVAELWLHGQDSEQETRKLKRGLFNLRTQCGVLQSIIDFLWLCLVESVLSRGPQMIIPTQSWSQHIWRVTTFQNSIGTISSVSILSRCNKLETIFFYKSVRKNKVLFFFLFRNLTRFEGGFSREQPCQHCDGSHETVI